VNIVKIARGTYGKVDEHVDRDFFVSLLIFTIKKWNKGEYLEEIVGDSEGNLKILRETANPKQSGCRVTRPRFIDFSPQVIHVVTQFRIFTFSPLALSAAQVFRAKFDNEKSSRHDK
jgi:hypothetical protein